MVTMEHNESYPHDPRTESCSCGYVNEELIKERVIEIADSLKELPDVNLPAHYPSTANSGIADARAFRVGDSSLVHEPGRFPDGNKVVAVCGVYGWATERDSRIASWADADITCKRCTKEM